MANAKQSSTPLSFKFSDIATLRATCERFISSREASTGVFSNSSKFEVKTVAGSKTEFDVMFERTIIGKPHGGDEEKIAFTATCQVAGKLVFDEPPLEQGDLPESLMREIAAPLFYIASERCSNLVVNMGYPRGPVATVLPGIASIDRQVLDQVATPVKAQKRKVLNARVPRKLPGNTKQ